MVHIIQHLIQEQQNVIKSEYTRDGGSSAKRVPTRILNDRELIGVRLPDVLGVIIVLWCHNDFVSDEESRVETHTKLSNQLRGGLSVSLHLCHLVQELACARLGDGSQVFHQFFFGHSNTGVSDVKHVLLFIRLPIKDMLPVSKMYIKRICNKLSHTILIIIFIP